MCRQRCYLFFLILLIANGTFAQVPRLLRVTVVDSLTREPLQGATLAVHGHSHFHLTNEAGIGIIDSLPSGALTLHVSYVGYHHLDIRLKDPFPARIQIELCPEAHHLHESLIQTSGMNRGFTGRNSSQLNETEINRRAAATLADMLKGINGVTVLSSSGGISKPVINGLHSQRVGLVQGNAMLEGQSWGEDHGPELDPFSAGGAEVIKGAATLEYGPNAIGGLVRVLRPSFRETPGMDGALRLQGRSNNRMGAMNLRIEGRTGQKDYLAARLQGTLRKAGDASAPDYVLSNTGFKDENASLELEGKKGAWRGQLQLSRFHSYMGILAASHLGNMNDLQEALASPVPLVIQPFSYAIGKPAQEVEHTLLHASVNYERRPGTMHRLTYTQQVNHRMEYDADRVFVAALQGRPAMDLELQTFTLQWNHSRKLNYHWSMQMGAMLQQQGNTIAGLQFIIPAFTAKSAGTWAIVKREGLGGTLSAGIRMDVRELEVPQFNRNAQTLSYSKLTAGSSAGLSWQRGFDHNWLLQLNLQTGWRPPAINELMAYGLHYGVASFESGDAKLQPERNWMAEVGLKKQRNKWNLELNIWHQYFKGFINRLPAGSSVLTIRGAFPLFTYQQQDAILSGVDARVRYVAVNGFQWDSKFSYLYAQDMTQHRPLMFMPANRMEHELMYAFQDFKGLHQTYMALGSVWVDEQRRVVPGLDYRAAPGAYWLLQVRAGFEMRVFANAPSWKVNISGENLLNRSYRDYQSRMRYFANNTGRDIVLQVIIPIGNRNHE